MNSAIFELKVPTKVLAVNEKCLNLNVPFSRSLYNYNASSFAFATLTIKVFIPILTIVLTSASISLKVSTEQLIYYMIVILASG